jgi:hypothetical protein
VPLFIVKHKPKNFTTLNHWFLGEIIFMETDLFSRSKIEEESRTDVCLQESTDLPSEKRVRQAEHDDGESARIKRTKLLSAETELALDSSSITETDSTLSLANQFDKGIEGEMTTASDTIDATDPRGERSDSEVKAPGLQAIYHQDFEEDYNEESDEDWNEEDSYSGDNGSDDDSHDGFFLGVNQNYNELEGNSGDEDEKQGEKFLHEYVAIFTMHSNLSAATRCRNMA